MATIALRGTETKKVVLKTIDGVQKVSCLCCGCASVPDEITVVFSGITTCPASPAYPAPLVSATLTQENPNESYYYTDALQEVSAGCTTAKQIYDALPGIDLTAYIPEGIAPDDTTTPLFIIQITGEAPSTGFGNAFQGLWAMKDSPVTNLIDFGDCAGRDEWAYGGTATLSWE
jgi:hypothetical protein